MTNKSDGTAMLGVRIPGMHCRNCAGRIERGLKAGIGISSVSIDLNGKSATITYDPTATDADTVTGTIRELGYECEPMEGGV